MLISRTIKNYSMTNGINESRITANYILVFLLYILAFIIFIVLVIKLCLFMSLNLLFLFWTK